jgi:hypothetical protein
MALSVMFEVYYRGPRDLARETTLTDQIVALGGHFDFWEENEIPGVCNYVCLTYEFDDWPPAERAAAVLRQQGEHVEGLQQYGQ